MLTEVRCSVADCAYYKEGNLCGAEKIMIEIDKHAAKSYDAEFGEESFSSEHQDAAQTSAATCCQTFKPKSRSEACGCR